MKRNEKESFWENLNDIHFNPLKYNHIPASSFASLTHFVSLFYSIQHIRHFIRMNAWGGRELYVLICTFS